MLSRHQLYQVIENEIFPASDRLEKLLAKMQDQFLGRGEARIGWTGNNEYDFSLLCLNACIRHIETINIRIDEEKREAFELAIDAEILPPAQDIEEILMKLFNIWIQPGRGVLPHQGPMIPHNYTKNYILSSISYLETMYKEVK